MTCEYTVYQLPTTPGVTSLPLRQRLENLQPIRCPRLATRYFQATHPRMLRSHPHGEHLCDEHYKDQLVLEDLLRHLDTPEGRRELFE